MNITLKLNARPHHPSWKGQFARTAKTITNGLATLAPACTVPLDAFQLRCWARACLVEQEMMSLQEAVDGLQDAAVSIGLVDLLGQDEVQSIMTKAFERDRKCRG